MDGPRLQRHHRVLRSDHVETVGLCTTRHSPCQLVSFLGHRDVFPSIFFFFSSRRRHTRYWRDWSSDVCSSDLDGRAVGLDACRELGISIFAGEAENRLDMLLRDAADGRLAAQYDFIKDLPELAGTPVPFLPKQYVARTLGLSASFDAGRGCPYQCSFCTIINVQGRKSRFRSADDIEHLIRLNWAQGIHKFFITDDNFARNREWESIFDRLILLRERDAIPLGLMIQVDTLCHKIPNFIEKAKL